MSTVFEGGLVIASHNQGKVREISDLLKAHVDEFFSATDLDLPEPVEDGDSFTENALIKARAAAVHTGKVAFSDDSGLCVNALGGEPGIYSARWAGPDKDFALAMQKVEEALAGKEDRSAYFVCVLALAWPDGRTEAFEGRVDGTLVWPARGEKGFGYDPIFVPDGYDVTFAEMEPADKHAISHRAKAFEKFQAWLCENG